MSAEQTQARNDDSTLGDLWEQTGKLVLKLAFLLALTNGIYVVYRWLTGSFPTDEATMMVAFMTMVMVGLQGVE